MDDCASRGARVIVPSLAEVGQLARGFRRRLVLSPAAKAARDLERLADRVPARVPQRVRFLELELECPDVRTTFYQFNDLFVKESARFASENGHPRILDCGANIGVASLYFKRLYPAARITAFEADPALCAMLRRNLEANGAPDVEIVEAAVWSADGSVTFRAEGTDSGAVDAVSGPMPGDAITVPSVSLRRWIEQEVVDLIKIDIEGAELAVLQDIEDLLPRVKAMIVEVHELRPGQRLLGPILDLLDRAHFATAVRSLTPASWRQVSEDGGPFQGAIQPFLVTVHTWRPS
jgi:FkbM family methyltransferase